MIKDYRVTPQTPVCVLFGSVFGTHFLTSQIPSLRLTNFLNSDPSFFVTVIKPSRDVTTFKFYQFNLRSSRPISKQDNDRTATFARHSSSG